MIKAVIFDLDGTLLDTIKTITYYLNAALNKHGVEGITEHECKYFIGNGARILVERALRSKNQYTEELWSLVYTEYNSTYNKDTKYLTEPYEGIRELIGELSQSGYLLGVLSNKPDDTTNNIIPEYFGDVFNCVHGGRDGIPLKPAPDGLTASIEELGILPSEVVYVGDTGVDMETGKRAGVHKTVGAAWGFRTVEELRGYGADVVIEHPLQLLSEVEG